MHARFFARALLALALAAGVHAVALAAPHLLAYGNEAELTDAIARWRAQAQRAQVAQRAHQGSALAMSMAPQAAAKAEAQPAPAAPAAADSAADQSITNVQTAGVDEGGIVKRAGEHLVILRRGRLFTVRVGGDALVPVASIPAYAPGIDPLGAWYDELLVAGRDVVVIGYSAARGGTEIGLFQLADDGQLSYRATYQLRSADYYASRNYASRLIGRKLVFYTPSAVSPWAQPLAQALPALRRWQVGQPSDFERILPATRVYRTDDEFAAGEPLALHTVTSCDLAAAALRCESSAVLGPPGRVFYVSQGSVYVWTNSGTPRWNGSRVQAQRSAVFRLPLDGTAPSGLKAVGVPLDAQSFLEDSQGRLNVLVREFGEGEAMAGAERSRGALALLRVPLADFADGSTAARRDQYRRLPGSGGALQNRYVGEWLLWGGSAGAWAVRPSQPEEAQPLAPGHGVERIEAMGAHAVLVGASGGDLHFSAVRLSPDRAQLAGRHVQAGASQGETRSHGFFYRASGDEDGLLGLPIATADGPRGAAAWGRSPVSAAVVVLRSRSLAFTALGELAARSGALADDGCKASCVDWYGNARPLFLGDRVLALMGYEIVEGRLGGGWRGERLEERRRISFAPLGPGRAGRPSPFE